MGRRGRKEFGQGGEEKRYISFVGGASGEGFGGKAGRRGRYEVRKICMRRMKGIH